MNIIRPGDPECAAIDKLRARIVATQADIRRTREAPWPRAHTAALVLAELQRRADSSADGPNRWAKVISPINAGAPFPELGWPLLLDLFGVDGVAKLVCDRIARLDLPEGLAPAERNARLRELERRLFDAQVEEELIICRIEAATHSHVLRGSNVNPAAVVAAWRQVDEAAA